LPGYVISINQAQVNEVRDIWKEFEWKGVSWESATRNDPNYINCPNSDKWIAIAGSWQLRLRNGQRSTINKLTCQSPSPCGITHSQPVVIRRIFPTPVPPCTVLPDSLPQYICIYEWHDGLRLLVICQATGLQIVYGI